MYFIIKLIAGRAFVNNTDKRNEISVIMKYIINVVLIISASLLSGNIIEGNSKPWAINEKINLAGYKKEICPLNVVKFENANALIYVKPVKSFYRAEHSPMICWTGSGYEFREIKKVNINGIEIYTGVLTKGNDRIYSSWWFDNGKYKTINQLEWRRKVICGESDFNLINVNTLDEKKLIIETQKILKKKFN
jgi:exosortase N